MTYELIETLPSLPPDVEAMLEHERVLVEKPALVRARLVARARESLRYSDDDFPKLARPSAWRPLWLAAAAGIVLIASVAAAVQLFRTSASPVSTIGPHTLSVVAPIPAPAPVPEHTTSQLPVGRATPSKADVVEELRFLDQARQAAACGDYATALALIADHERRFPHGRLAEDREVLRMRAFVGLGRGNEARTAAAKFRHQFPRSVLLPKIDALLDWLH